MNEYEEEYFALINKAKADNRRWEPFKFEEHHILPKCMGGSDEKDNLILLTTAEHFKAHVLLSRAYPKNGKLALACVRMMDSWQGKQLDLIAEEFAEIREKAARFISTIHKGRKKSEQELENIRQARLNAKPRKFSEQAKANMAEARRKTWAERKANGTVMDIISKTVATRKANGSYVLSEERKRQISEQQMGREPWNKGKKGVSEETRAKMSAKKKGREPWNKGLKATSAGKDRPSGRCEKGYSSE